MFVEEWKVESIQKTGFDKRSFGEHLADYGRDGWNIIAVNYVQVANKKKIQRAVTLQRLIG